MLPLSIINQCCWDDGCLWTAFPAQLVVQQAAALLCCLPGPSLHLEHNSRCEPCLQQCPSLPFTAVHHFVRSSVPFTNAVIPLRQFFFTESCKVYVYLETFGYILSDTPPNYTKIRESFRHVLSIFRLKHQNTSKRFKW